MLMYIYIGNFKIYNEVLIIKIFTLNLFNDLLIKIVVKLKYK